MGQNLASVHLHDAQWAAFDAAMTAMEQAAEPMLVVLGSEGRRRAVRMGDKSEAFCRRAYGVMRENASLIPTTVDLDEMARDLASHDALAQRHARLVQFMEKMQDTDIALGSDVMAAALTGYALLKLTGRTEGLDTLQRELGKRFERSGRRKAEPLTRAA